MENIINTHYENFGNFMAEYIATYPYCDDSQLSKHLGNFNKEQIDILMNDFFNVEILKFLYNINQKKITDFVKTVEYIKNHKPTYAVYVPPHKRVKSYVTY